MHVDPANTFKPHPTEFGKPVDKGQGMKQTDAAPAKHKATPSLSDEANQSQQVETTNKTENIRGVLRLLQEGHFKGVADVRLRINFYDELAAIEGARLRAVAEEKVTALTESVTPYVRNLVETGQIAEELANALTDDFAQNVNHAIENFLQGQTPSKDALAGELTSAFHTFVASLAAMTTQSIETTDGLLEETAVVEGILEEVAAELVEGGTAADEQTKSKSPHDITTAFETALQQFLAALNDVRILPELSSPQGNGVAYRKFLDIYNELLGPTSEGAAEAESIDIVT